MYGKKDRKPAPVSERQQLQLLKQITSEAEQVPTSHSSKREWNDRGETGLHIAAKKGDAEWTRKLLEQGVNPNATDYAGWTALHEAANHGHYNVALLLVKAGANVNAIAIDEITPLHDACMFGQLKMVKMLIEKGADPTMKNKKGKTPQDVAHPSLQNFFANFQNENANRREQLNKQKTNTDDKKQASNEEHEDNAANTSASNATVESKVEDDIYEFKSTPKDSSCSSGDDKSDAGKHSHSDKSSDEKSGTDSDTPNPNTTNTNLPQAKRPFADVDTPDENASTTDDESKRKKRKDNESVTTKDNIKGLTGNRNLTRQEKNPSKTANITNKNLTNLEGKSPTPSPKPVKPEGVDAETDDTKSSTDDVPKVPPLKIVIPQQNNSGDQEVGGSTKTNKNTSNRSQNALPYVVASSDNSGDKEAASTGSLSPDLTKGLDEKSSKNSDDRAQQRVLRSALRGNAQGSSASDRNSNNSSPQNSASPSPAPITDTANQNSTAMAPTTNTDENNSSGGQAPTPNSGNTNEEVTDTPNQAPSASVNNNQASTANQNENNNNSAANNSQTTTSNVTSNPPTATTPNNNNNTSNPLPTSNSSMTPSNSDSNQTSTANSVTTTNNQNSGSNQASAVSTNNSNNAQVSTPNTSSSTANSSGNCASNNNNNSNSVASSNSEENNSSSNNNSAANGSNSNNNSSLSNNSSNNDTEPSNNNNLTTNSASNNNNASPTAVQQQQTTPSEAETTRNTASPANQASSIASTSIPSVELHPRKRKIRTSKETTVTAPPTFEEKPDTSNIDLLPAEQPYHNCYQMYLNIRKQIERKHRNLVPITPKPPQGYKDYLMNRRTYVLAGKTPAEPNIIIPTNLAPQMKDLFVTQEKERHKLKTQHIVEKEKLVLSVEQEIVRVHCRAARTLANQSQPFSVATILKDQEVYKVIEPSEQEDKDRNSRGAPKGRLFLSWLQDVDDKWEKIKEAMILRHHNEAESLHAVQKMDWEFKMKEVSLCDYKAKPDIEEQHVPIVNVSDDFDLLPC